MEHWPHLNPSFFVDTFSVNINRPRDDRAWEYYVGSEAKVKYQIVCSLVSPRIISLDGPYKGPAQDGSIASVTLGPKIRPGEKGYGDKQYRNCGFILCPVSGLRFQLSNSEKYFNYTIYSNRQDIERLIRRVKSFGCMKVRWPYSLELHQLAVVAIGKLVNLSLSFEPLDSDHDPD